MNKYSRKIPILFLIISISFLGLAVTTLLIGSGKSRIYNQMAKTGVVDNFDELISMGNEPFLLHSYIDKTHNIIDNNMVATNNIRPELTLLIDDKSVQLLSGYGIADYNIRVESSGVITEGIKPGGDITIYAVNYKDDLFSGIKGYELYPGTPKQYLNFLKSPYNDYMLYVRIFIGVALLFFIVSIVINIKK